MGRNTSTSRQVMESFAQAIGKFANSMPQEDMKIFQEMLISGRIHASQFDLSTISTESAFILSILIEILKKFSEESR